MNALRNALRHAHAIAQAIQQDVDEINLSQPKWRLDNRSGQQMRQLTSTPLSFRAKGLTFTLDEAERVIVVTKAPPGRTPREERA